jgi:hypothetical protein
MWTCPKCGRIFDKKSQPHSCQKIPLKQHFKNKDKAKELFDHLVMQIDAKIGKFQTISIPCCIHLFGNYDFLAALPKKDKLEIRFNLDRKLNTPKLKQAVPVTTKLFKNCINLNTKKDIDRELLKWLLETYHLRD